jgi:hypothetical protein
VAVFARELLGIGRRLWVRGAICIALKGDCWHADGRAHGELNFHIVIFWLARSQAKSPAIIVGDNTHMIRIVERLRSSIEGVIIEVPFGRGGLPNQLCKIMPIFLIPGTTTFGCQIILIPPLQLSLGRQRYLPGLLATDQIPTHGDQSFTTLRP